MKKVYSIYDDEGLLIKSTSFNDEGLQGGWFVMYKDSILHLLNECKELTKLKVFMFLASRQTFDTLIVTNVTFISKSLKMSYKSAWLAVKWLEDNDYIKRVEIDGVHGFLINPSYTTCGRKSLKQKRMIWERSLSEVVNKDTGEIVITSAPSIDSVVKNVFGEQCTIEEPSDDEVEDFDPFGFQRSDV